MFKKLESYYYILRFVMVISPAFSVCCPVTFCSSGEYKKGRFWQLQSFSYGVLDNTKIPHLGKTKFSVGITAYIEQVYLGYNHNKYQHSCVPQ